MKSVDQKPTGTATLIFGPNANPDLYLNAANDVELMALRVRLYQWAKALTIDVWKNRARERDA